MMANTESSWGAPRRFRVHANGGSVRHAEGDEPAALC